MFTIRFVALLYKCNLAFVNTSLTLRSDTWDSGFWTLFLHLNLSLEISNVICMKLYVNDFSKDKAMAVTFDKQLINYNLDKLVSICPSQTQVFVLGRYFSLLVNQKDARNRRMLFFDLREDRSLVHDIITSLKNYPLLQRKFISMMEIYNLQYENNFEAVELSMDWPSS